MLQYRGFIGLPATVGGLRGFRVLGFVLEGYLRVRRGLLESLKLKGLEFRGLGFRGLGV